MKVDGPSGRNFDQKIKKSLFLKNGVERLGFILCLCINEGLQMMGSLGGHLEFGSLKLFIS